MFKNQGFIYLTRSQLTTAPVLKLSHQPGPTLPIGFSENHGVLALWPISAETSKEYLLLDHLHAGLIRAGLTFSIPTTYQASLSQMVKFIDEWLEVERHFEGNQEHNDFENELFPSNTKYIPESSINLLQLGRTWLSLDPSFEHSAASAFYRGMIHGQAECQLELAKCYEEGVGVEINFSRARELLTTIKRHDVYPMLLRLSYREQKNDLAVKVKDDFFNNGSLPIPGKNHLNVDFHQSLLEMLWVSFEQTGHFDFWLGCWELIAPYRDELLALSEVRVMDTLDTPDASQTRYFHDILAKSFQVYRQIA